MATANEKNSDGMPEVSRMVEDIVGCKWSLVVLGHVRAGTRRPGAIERATPGLTAKVLNERLSKMVRYRILERESYPEVPPRVSSASRKRRESARRS